MGHFTKSSRRCTVIAYLCGSVAKSVFPLGLVYYTDGETTLGRCRPNSFLASAPLQSLLQVLHADLAAADARQELARFERL